MTGREEILLLAVLRDSVRSGEARRVRESAQVSATEVAHALGVTPGAVTNWESGLRQPRGDLALRYAQLLQDLAKVTG